MGTLTKNQGGDSLLASNNGKSKTAMQNASADTSHIGGINDQLGGVDPQIDDDLMRLAGGP